MRNVVRFKRRRAVVSFGELRLTMLLAALLGLAYVQWQSPSPAAQAEPVSASPPSTAAVEVIDGDTFRYGGEKIRIADIDTPEVKARCAYEARLAGQATARLGQLLAAGPFELQRVERDEDRYGRKLRIVTRDGRSLGDQLVAEGLARTWTGRRQPWCA
jgi:micrococcal nuclease